MGATCARSVGRPRAPSTGGTCGWTGRNPHWRMKPVGVVAVAACATSTPSSGLHACAQGPRECWLLPLLHPGYPPTVAVALAAGAAVCSVVVAAAQPPPPPNVAAGTVRLWLMRRQQEDWPSSVRCDAVHAVTSCSTLLLLRGCGVSAVSRPTRTLRLRAVPQCRHRKHARAMCVHTSTCERAQYPTDPGECDRCARAK